VAKSLFGSTVRSTDPNQHVEISLVRDVDDGSVAEAEVMAGVGGDKKARHEVEELFGKSARQLLN